jgi:hypothetical protein
MAVRKSDLHPPPILRAHRPKPADTLTPIQADAQETVTEDVVVHPSWLRRNLLYIGVGMFCMVVLWMIGTMVVIPFIYNTNAHWNCGEARICQYDLDVGHGGTSHFITQYYRNQVIIIEAAHNDYVHTHIYVAEIFVKGDNTQHVIDLKTMYVNKHATSGKPDLVVSVSGFAVPIVLYNTGTQFSTEQP